MSNKILNNKFYGVMSIKLCRTSEIEQTVADKVSLKFLNENYEFYKNRNPWMTQHYLKRIIDYLERDIRRKYCG